MSQFHFNLAEIGRTLSAPLVVVIPVYNEAENISDVILAWSRCLRQLAVPFQIIALNDGSKDATQECLRQLEASMAETLCVISKPNSGHGTTCRIGYDIAVNSKADWVLQIDSDGQCDPRHFFDFWTLRDASDCIFGVRESREDGLARTITSNICRLGSSLLCGQDLRDPNVPYRLIRTTALRQALQYIPPSFNIHNVALTYVLKKLPGLRWQYVPIHFPDRSKGTNSINVLRVTTWGIEMLLELLWIRVHPLTKTG